MYMDMIINTTIVKLMAPRYEVLSKRVGCSGPIGRTFINSFKIFFSGIGHLACK